MSFIQLTTASGGRVFYMRASAIQVVEPSEIHADGKARVVDIQGEVYPVREAVDKIMKAIKAAGL
jgi:hypothetical protein